MKFIHVVLAIIYECRGLWKFLVPLVKSIFNEKIWQCPFAHNPGKDFDIFVLIRGKNRSSKSIFLIRNLLKYAYMYVILILPYYGYNFVCIQSIYISWSAHKLCTYIWLTLLIIADDELILNDGQQFSTIDNDNDDSTQNCADLGRGGWWYFTCFHVRTFININ